MKRIMVWISMFSFIGVLLCFTPACDINEPQTEDNRQNTQKPEVYVVHSSHNLIGSWKTEYGVIREDGTLLLPIAYDRVQILTDAATGEAVRLQSIETQVSDDVEKSEDILEQYYQSMHMGEGEPFFVYRYQLYDLNGKAIGEPSDCGIRQICGDLTLYQNNRLVYSPTGEVLMDNCDSITFGENSYIIVYEQYKKVRVLNANLEVLLDVNGSESFIDSGGRVLIVTVGEDGKQGLSLLDGTQLVPEEYDYFMTYYSVQAPYVQAVKDDITSVISLSDGHVVYTAADNYEYVQELFDDFMVIQKRGEIEKEGSVWPVYEYVSQLYDYNGRPLGKIYRSLSPENDLYQRTKAQTGKGVLLFRAEEMNGDRCFVDENGRIIYKIADGEWVSALTENSLIVNNQDWSFAELRNLGNEVLNKKEYESINNLYLGAKGANGYYSRSDLAVGWYTYNNVQLADVLDAEGNILIERLKSVDMLSENRFWVEKGFSRGLMDREGNWIYEQTRFDSETDE